MENDPIIGILTNLMYLNLHRLYINICIYVLAKFKYLTNSEKII